VTREACETLNLLEGEEQHGGMTGAEMDRISEFVLREIRSCSNRQCSRPIRRKIPRCRAPRHARTSTVSESAKMGTKMTVLAMYPMILGVER